MGSMGGPPARPAWAGPAPPPARHSGHRCSASPDGSSTGLNLGFTPLGALACNSDSPLAGRLLGPSEPRIHATRRTSLNLLAG